MLQKLPEKIQKNGYFYTLVKRDQNKAIYKSNTGFYEVFVVRIQQPGEAQIANTRVIYEHKELFPHDEGFGEYAWCYSKGDPIRRLSAEQLAEECYNNIPEELIERYR